MTPENKTGVARRFRSSAWFDINMKLKSMIFYATTDPACDKIIVVAHHRKSKKPFHAYLRVEVVDSDALHALDMAKPKRGETVLNAIELP